MRKDDKRTSDNIELGSLALDSEKIELEQAQEYVNAPALRGKGSQLAGRAAVDDSVSSKQNAPKKYPVLPGGLILLIALILICCMGRTLQVQRASAIGFVSGICSQFAGPDACIESRHDVAAALAANHEYDKAEQQHQSLISELSRRYGEQDQKVASARLALASFYLDLNRETQAHEIWASQLKIIQKPLPGIPRGTTDVLLHMAERYNSYDQDSARILYQAALNLWPLAPGHNTISNVESDLALIQEQQGRYAEANENYKKAYEFTQNWGNTGNTTYNVYRLLHIGSTYNSLGKFQEAIPYLMKGEKMAREVGAAADPWREDIENQIEKAGRLHKQSLDKGNADPDSRR